MNRINVYHVIKLSDKNNITKRYILLQTQLNHAKLHAEKIKRSGIFNCLKKKNVYYSCSIDTDITMHSIQRKFAACMLCVRVCLPDEKG